MRPSLVAIFGPYVDPHIFDSTDLFTVFRCHEVDRFLADDAREFARVAHHANPLPHQLLSIPATDALEVDQAFVVDVGDQ